MLRRRISLIWTVWVLLLGAIAVAWVYSLGSLETCLYDAKTGTYWCLTQGALCVESGITWDSAPSTRFEISQSSAGNAITQPELTLPLWFPALVIFLSVPLARGWRYARKVWSGRHKPRLCIGCGYELTGDEPGSCPQCGSVFDASPSVASSTAVALPCPNCQYDLRGLPSGKCPECAMVYDKGDLRPMREGLALERWQADATTWWRRAAFPWRVGFSPIAAFRRECPTDRVLTISPARYVLWIIFGFVALALANNAITYTVDGLRGIYSVFGYEHGGSGWRYCSLSLLPVQLPIAWLQSVSVCVVGMAIGWRMLTPWQVVYLATWITGLGLLASSLATLYEEAWDTFLGGWISTWRFIEPMSLMRILDVARGLETRSSDLFLGLLAGLAVGTVMGRRRWLVALVSAGILYAGFPLYVAVQGHYGYLGLVHRPLRDAVLGHPLPPPDLAQGPTFAADEGEPVLAGRWEVHCKAGRDMAVTEIVIDTTGRLTHFRVVDPGSKQDRLFVVDGESHEIEVTDWAGNPSVARYRCFGGCRRTESKVEINTRLEWYIHMGGPNDEEMPNIYEHTFVGRLDEVAGSIKGTNVVVVDSRFAVIIHPRRERAFNMRRLPLQSQSRAP